MTGAPIGSTTTAPISAEESISPIASGAKSQSPTYYPANPTTPTSLPPVDQTPMTNPPVSIATPTPSAAGGAVTSPPTFTGTSIATLAPSTPGNDNLHPVFLQYGISSNCGVTASDVLNANDNTIMEGLIAATEVLVVDILNTTFPRDALRTNSHKIFHGTYAEYYARGSDSHEDASIAETVLTNFFVDNDLKMVQESSQSDAVVYLNMAQPSESEFRQGQNTRKRKKKHKRQSKQENDRVLASLVGSNPRHRNLVYWTPMYPIEITNVDDVLDDACPAGVNCMKVLTTVKVVLEEGDDAQAVEDAIKKGVEGAFTDGTFFQVREWIVLFFWTR
jgi:hypothetical protein